MEQMGEIYARLRLKLQTLAIHSEIMSLAPLKKVSNYPLNRSLVKSIFILKKLATIYLSNKQEING